ncbi:MAG: tRNA (N(6)-L-threonylcarbamoyladenosine(37)-C(2))-methylthiotransferase MtaB [Thermodesulfobacteriales bacterium]|nr:MAG: tRNA (N(6)-L-threonylcarbamoyladenosine(37)-C(2))-methylthiotransferase MtaB [Thermodesulfobacteriales bacterium]
MKSISIVTLGCKVNQYDTAVILNQLPKSKYRRVPFSDKADVYVIDTCTVTHKADAEARNYINRAKRANPNGVVVVTGCYAQVSPQELKEVHGVDYVIGNSHKFSSLLKIIREGKRQEEPKVFISDIFKEKKKGFESPDIEIFPGRTRAFLKVQDGCNYACTFCIIPRARGRSRSLEIAEILNRMEKLAHSGYKEIVLTGVHIASYGREIGTNFFELLREIEKEKIVNRVRLTSLDPADTELDLIDFIADSQTICPQFHIALQSGDQDVLKRMRRRYGPEKFLDLTDKIRERMPDAAIGSDIMVGFPAETEEEFLNTYEIARDSALTYFHVFPYSKRKMTPAAVMPEQIHPSEVKERSKRLRELGSKKKTAFFKQFIGRTFPVLIERGSKGTTPNYIPVRFDTDAFNIGDEVLIRINDVVNEEAIGVAEITNA